MKEISYEALASLAGQELGVSDYVLVDQARIQAFADATLDRQWIHVDTERAQRELGGTIVHGYLTLSLLPYLSYGLLRVTGASRTINYGLDRVRFTDVVRAGSRLRARQRCVDVTDKAQGKLLRLASAIELEGGARPVCVVEALSLIMPAP